jgi:hypothetical protein
MKRSPIVTFCLFLLSLAASASAGIITAPGPITFWLDTSHEVTFAHTSTISGSVLTVELFDILSEGVTFDATLTVTGNGSFVSNNTSGLGVGGNTVKPGASLSFGTPVISNESGGTVVFNGFGTLDLNSFTSAGSDSATIGATSLSGGQDPYDLTSLPGGSPNAFIIAGTAGSFQLDSVSASFTGTAIPEPSGFLFSGIAACGLIWSRRRKV